jgi:hypothetical protein
VSVDVLVNKIPKDNLKCAGDNVMEIKTPPSLRTLLTELRQARIVFSPSFDKDHGLFSVANRESRVAFSMTTSNDFS